MNPKHDDTDQRIPSASKYQMAEAEVIFQVDASTHHKIRFVPTKRLSYRNSQWLCITRQQQELVTNGQNWANNYRGPWQSTDAPAQICSNTQTHTRVFVIGIQNRLSEWLPRLGWDKHQVWRWFWSSVCAMYIHILMIVYIGPLDSLLFVCVGL